MGLFDEEDRLVGFYKETWRKANKDHECGTCKGQIAKDIRYCLVTSLLNGKISSSKLCNDCFLESYGYEKAPLVEREIYTADESAKVAENADDPDLDQQQ